MRHLIIAIAVAISCGLMLQPAEAGKKLKPRNSYTAAQREKMINEGRKVCRKAYGANSRLMKIDYVHSRYICSEYHS